MSWKWRPGLHVAHAFVAGRLLCGEVAGLRTVDWTPSDRQHCRMCTRRLPKPLTWTQGAADQQWPDCSICCDWLWQPFMREAIASVSIEHPVNVKRLVEQYHEGGHRDE